MRRAGRFEREITIGVPNEEARVEIMKILTKKMRLRPDFPFNEMIKLTPGYVGADIQTLCKEASIIAVERIINSQNENVPKENVENEEDENKDKELIKLENYFIEIDDFKAASKRV